VSTKPGQLQFFDRRREKHVRIDLARLSIEELEKIVADRCSRFGAVSQVVIMQDNDHPFALAGVVMSDASGAVAVLRNLGGSMIQDRVLIRLEQQ
jgi:hypothetical protein